MDLQTLKHPRRLLRPKKYPVSGAFFFLGEPVKYVMYVHAVTGTRQNFPYTKYGGYARPHKLGKHQQKSFNTQGGGIPIDPAILASIGHHFIATKKKEN